jgi:hypothetical protein
VESVRIAEDSRRLSLADKRLYVMVTRGAEPLQPVVSKLLPTAGRGRPRTRSPSTSALSALSNPSSRTIRRSGSRQRSSVVSNN